jgi:hypothetical protein
MKSTARQHNESRIQLGRRRRPPGGAQIEWADYPRIAPGVYCAYSAVAKTYFDRGYRRWVCFVRWNVLSADGMRVVARVPLWWTLGDRERPHATRRSKYFVEWVRANGGPPIRGDRLSPKVFRRRLARVEIRDTDARKSLRLIRLLTRSSNGKPGRTGSFSQQVTQSRRATGNSCVQKSYSQHSQVARRADGREIWNARHSEKHSAMSPVGANTSSGRPCARL